VTLGKQFPLIDRLLGGTLVQRLTDERTAGDSYFTMAARFTLDGFSVSSETVRQWCMELGIEKPRSGQAA
jgi:hypothetical protein